MIRYLDAGSDFSGIGNDGGFSAGESPRGLINNSLGVRGGGTFGGGRGGAGAANPSPVVAQTPIRVIPTTPTPAPTIITPTRAPISETVFTAPVSIAPSVPMSVVETPIRVATPAPPPPLVTAPVSSAPAAPMQMAEIVGGTRASLGPVRNELQQPMVDTPIRVTGPMTGVPPRPIPISEAQIADEINTKALSLANEMIKVVRDQSQVAASGRVFTRFDFASDVIENQKVFVTTGLFTNNAATMSAMYTGSTQSATSKQYYYDAWNGDSNTSESQFSIAYGHRLGSGSYGGGGSMNDAPSRAIYSQYRLLLLEPGDTTFTFANGASTNSIYAINFNRARLKDKLDPGNWQFELGELSGSAVANASHTGSNVKLADNPKIISLVDDSGDTFQTRVTSAGRVFNIVSGSITNGVYNSSAPHYYGLVYPDMGMLILNGDTLNLSASFNTVTGSGVAGDNAWKLFTAISGAMSIDPVGNAFQARNSETVTSTHYFVRVKNGEYNFSNNPSFTTGSVGEFAQPTFIGNPKTYITTVGMYNDRQELLAVAKLSQPVQKSFSNESLIKVKLDF